MSRMVLNFAFLFGCAFFIAKNFDGIETVSPNETRLVQGGDVCWGREIFISLGDQCDGVSPAWTCLGTNWKGQGFQWNGPELAPLLCAVGCTGTSNQSVPDCSAQ